MALARASRLEDWLVDLSERTRKVAERALRAPDAGRVVARGAYGLPTVRADARAERVILEAYRDAPIPLNLFSEEAGHRRTPGAEYTLIADPIDGTRNAVRRIPFYCVCLAIGRRTLSGVDLAVVREGARNTVYSARRGKGAHHEGRRIRVRRLDARNVIVAAALDYERRVRIRWRPYVHFRDMGSSALEMCLIASGGIDLFLSTKSYLRVVDVAASTLILREAGGLVLDLKRKPLNAGYDLKERVSLYAMGDRRALKVLG